MQMPPLATNRLLVRPFALDDLAAAHRILDMELGEADTGTEGTLAIEQRRAWLEWSALSYEQLAYLHQPPYGDRAIALRETGELVGACGYVQCLGPFGLLPSLRAGLSEATARLFTPEFGLYWAISPAHQRQGYATEAAAALIDYAFAQLQLRRIVATTAYDNIASQGVMRRLGMRIEHNPSTEPPWFQVVGILEHNLAIS